MQESRMRYVLMTEPQQGMSYADQLAAAKRAEANGFDAYFRADHFASFPGAGGEAACTPSNHGRRPCAASYPAFSSSLSKISGVPACAGTTAKFFLNGSKDPETRKRRPVSDLWSSALTQPLARHQGRRCGAEEEDHGRRGAGGAAGRAACRSAAAGRAGG